MAVAELPSKSEKETKSVDFVTLGMFIIDEIEFLPPKSPVHNALGGAGAFAALGARVMSPPPHNTSIAWIVDQGSDFPESIAVTINSWNSGVLYRRDDKRLTTRGWNGYGDAEHRAFRYLTPKKRLTAQDLTDAMVLSKTFHLVCSPARCRDIVTELTQRRKSLSPAESYIPPIFVWEPVPDLCSKDQLAECAKSLAYVDVCSPNHAELAAYMGETGLDENGDISVEAVLRNSEALLKSAPHTTCSIVVRAGHRGCYVTRYNSCQSKHHQEESQQSQEITGSQPLSKWIPAYHTDSKRVVDPTGGGNTFLGGLAVGLARGHDIQEAAYWGSVAASYAIEQIGVPVVSIATDGKETWNSSDAQSRLAELKSRTTSLSW